MDTVAFVDCRYVDDVDNVDNAVLLSCNLCRCIDELFVLSVGCVV